MFRTKKALFLIMASGTLLGFGGGCAGPVLRQLILNIPVGLGRQIGTVLEPSTGLANLFGGLGNLIPGVTG